MEKILITDKEYPQLLKQIKNPPKQLYIKGHKELLNQNSISIIGSRRCTENGFKIAKYFARKLASMGLVITSGMAKGIDTAAHIGALEVGGKTVAVMGTGFNTIFPEENKELFNDIIKNNGTIITEYSPDIGIEAKRFIERNRIVSGLSIGTLIIEAAYRSGTSITAKFAKSENRKVFCIAHGIEEKLGIGTNRLLKNGAILVTTVDDITKEFNFLKLNKIELNEKIVNKEYEKVYKEISNIPIHINNICKKSKLRIQEVNYILTMLEIEGYIQSLPGKEFILSMEE